MPNSIRQRLVVKAARQSDATETDTPTPWRTPLTNDASEPDDVAGFGNTESLDHSTSRGQSLRTPSCPSFALIDGWLLLFYRNHVGFHREGTRDEQTGHEHAIYRTLRPPSLEASREVPVESYVRAQEVPQRRAIPDIASTVLNCSDHTLGRRTELKIRTLNHTRR
jgi:hypothetical protein